jgi:hypothetical protein
MSETDRLPSRARRRFLSSTALGGLGCSIGRVGGAGLDRAADERATHKLYADRCKLASDGYHEQLAAEERARLGPPERSPDRERRWQRCAARSAAARS